MTTTYSKIKGRPKGYRYRNSIVDLQRELYKRNAKKTPKELDMHERFEDVPTELSDRDKDYGRVFKKPTEISKGSVNSIYSNDV
jgi:hypothetical protein